MKVTKNNIKLWLKFKKVSLTVKKVENLEKNV